MTLAAATPARNFAGLFATPGLGRVLDALPEARLVGGCVRDAIAGRPVADIDLATPDPPEHAAVALRRAGLRVIPTGIAHGTLTVLSGPGRFEVTTLRRDVATDGRHATVAWTDDWREDAARRDFTVNAMSLSREGRVFDPFGGRTDLAAGRVRFVGDAQVRIAEDALRILRFFRFQARYGRGEPDPEAAAAIASAADRISRLSGERIWSELQRILTLADPIDATTLMQRLGVLDAALPGACAEALARLVRAGGPADPLLRLAALLGVHWNAAAVGARLRLSTAERDRLALLLTPGGPAPGADADELRRWLDMVPVEALDGRAWLAGGDAPGWPDLRVRLAATPRPAFPLEGRDALACGMTPGPEVGLRLHEVRTWWRDSGCVAGRDACLARLRAVIAQVSMRR